jgi:hypothetical protein
MNEWRLPWTGHCRCGATRFQVTAAPLLTMACHCTGCQRMSASAFSLSVAVPADAFSVTEGQAVIGGLGGNDIQHFFCPRCMSWMFTRPLAVPSLVNVRATMLEQHGWFKPYLETWTREKLPWAVTGAPRSYEAMPAFEDFEQITREFQQRGARPRPEG